MTNQPAVITPLNDWALIKEQAHVLVSSGMIPRSIRTPEAAIAIMVKGRELGIQPMHAFSHIHIVEGKPTMSAELMLTMILKNVPDAKVEFLEVSDQACRIRAFRPAMGTFEFAFTREDATRAGLMNKDNWKKYTRAMLRSRAVSEMARSMFPDALSGISYTPEELGSAVEVTDSGEIIVAEEVRPSSPNPIIRSPRQQKIDQITSFVIKFGREAVLEVLDISESSLLRSWDDEKLQNGLDKLAAAFAEPF